MSDREHLWFALGESSTQTARREWANQQWYVAQMTSSHQDHGYRVVSCAGEGWHGWQVENLVQAGSLLVEQWHIDARDWRLVWQDWTPVAEPLEAITGPLRYIRR